MSTISVYIYSRLACRKLQCHGRGRRDNLLPLTVLSHSRVLRRLQTVDVAGWPYLPGYAVDGGGVGGSRRRGWPSFTRMGGMSSEQQKTSYEALVISSISILYYAAG